MTNLLKAIKTLVENPIIDWKIYYNHKQRKMLIGDNLNSLILDLFANTIKKNDENTRMIKFSECFSYIGNENNPPNLILKDGDAVKIKLLDSKSSEIKMTSSYPRSRLFYDDPAIGSHCFYCENWKVKDLIYVLGITENNSIAQLWFVYGDCYFADRKIYEKLLDITDPLRVTKFNNFQKCRIANPNKVFDYLPNQEGSHQFNCQCILRLDKYYSFPFRDRRNLESLAVNNKINILDIEIKSPEQPEKIISAKLIKFSYD